LYGTTTVPETLKTNKYSVYLKIKY